MINNKCKMTLITHVAPKNKLRLDAALINNSKGITDACFFIFPNNKHGLFISSKIDELEAIQEDALFFVDQCFDDKGEYKGTSWKISEEDRMRLKDFVLSINSAFFGKDFYWHYVANKFEYRVFNKYYHAIWDNDLYMEAIEEYIKYFPKRWRKEDKDV